MQRPDASAPAGDPEGVPAPRPGATRSPAWRFAGVALLVVALFCLDYWALVLTETGQRIENQGLLGAALHDPGVRADSVASLTQIGLASFAVALLVVFGAAFLQRRPGLGLLAATVMVASVGLAEVLKDVLPRPELVAVPAWLLRNSFPSGSATVAAAIGIGALLVTPGRLRWLVMPAGAVYAAVIGQATLVAGWHRMSGAIAGALLVIAVAAVAIVVLAARGMVQESAIGRVNPVVRSTLVLAGAASILAGAGLLVLPVVFPLLGSPEGALNAFTQTSSELVAMGVTLLVFVLFAVALEPYALGLGPLAPRPARQDTPPEASDQTPA